MTAFFCWKCKTKDHWADEPCKANGETPLDQPVIPVAPQGVCVDRPERRPEQIKKVEEFLKKVGRPKLNRTPEEKRKMRTAYMKEYRERNR